jgi:4-amino-4-deoxy-L-arabinose transferase-like glycosyltransferase
VNSASVRAALIGAFVAALTTLPGLGVGTLWDNSETAYGEVAREILLTGNWVVMHQNGAPWYVQPPLYFWIAAVFAKLFGVTEFALRLPSALATIVMAAAVGYVVARVAPARAAILSATILSTALMQAVVGRLAIMDALLDLAVTLAILSWFGTLRTGNAFYWYAGWVALALGTLAKGPVAPVIAILVVVPWALWERRAGQRLLWPSRVRVVLGIALCVAIVAPWALALAHAAGPIAFSEMLGHYTVGRYLGTIENQSGPVYYYVPVLILGFFPWIAYLIPAVADAWSDARVRETGALARLSLVWLALPFAFFSFAQTKLPNYIALELPACAVMVGVWFDRVAERSDRRAALWWTAIVPVGIVLIGIAMLVFSHVNRISSDLDAIRGDFLALGAALLVGSIVCFALLQRPRLAFVAPFALAAASVAVMLIIAIAEPLVERFKPIPPLAAVVERDRKPGDAIAIQGVSGGNALAFYTVPGVAHLTNPGETSTDLSTDPRHTICSARRAFVITSKKRPTPDPTYGRNRHVLATANNRVLFLYDGPSCSANAN